MLEVRNLSASYGQHRALEDASLRVGKGEIVVILGANGAGKSTLLKALSGICEGRATGSVTLDGEELIGQRPDRIVEAGLALVPEGRGVFGDLTVQENLLLGAYAKRARDDEAANVDRVLGLFPKLGERRRQVVRTMSGGEQQMVAIGRAMMSSPQVLALDEPSLGLSPLLCKELFNSLKAVRETGVGVLLVEQNARQSLRIADRGYLLENGSIVHEDSAAELARDPAVQKAYLGGGGGQAAPHPAPSRPATPAAPRPRSGPSPSEIAAAAIGRVSPPPRPARPEPARAPAQPAPPAPQPVPQAPPKQAPTGAPDVGALVARASAMASRRTNGHLPTRPATKPAQPAPAPATPRPPMPDLGPSTDRLRAMLDEIETAARRAETYRPGPTRRE
ncbi:ABC transporter ATP-binding protein [Mameliella alba]|nr:ABC transporter ATP-binding protein [Mameliella alba]MBY6121871.1 ABC transporter ATP-binding protein [Mameliella alba]OWV40162.1 ABC transporter ATP-binding protein [Mameliella alba]OWV59962.1 ABC transporter ATP-binding protein [Mameliella alba]